MMSETYLDAFRSAQQIPETDQCVMWAGSRGTGEYGAFTWRGERDTAHRASYQAHVGPIPDGQLIRHVCDTPGCINPRHLIPGTFEDNTRDAIERGRMSRTPPGVGWSKLSAEQRARGERIHTARLTEDDVRTIRRLREEGVSMYQLAKDFGVSRQNIRFIVLRKTWIHVA